MKEKRYTLFAWIFFGVITFSTLIALGYYFATSAPGEEPSLFEMLFPLVPVLFTFVGALIISRHPRNVIGLLMMLPGVSVTFVIDAYLAPYLSGQIPPPASPSIFFLLVLWFSNWNWLLLVLPVIFIMALFPTARPLSPRWNWLVYFGAGIVVIFVLLITFAEVLAPGTDTTIWQVPNPIGFLKIEWIDAITSPILILFPLWILLCAVSLFVRFHRARAVEREQIKWLFYAGAIFVLFYMPSFSGNTYSQAENLWNLLLPIGMLTFPAAIAIAILRYRLYDVDIIIRRTLQYALLTGLLALVYFGSVVLLQNLFETLTGQQSPFIIVISTLTIAALFNPLRHRIQEFIDRRFYRKKYNAEQALMQFAATARDEVDMDVLTTALLGMVEDTMQPEQVSMWLKPTAIRSSIPPSRGNE
jgi:hypothetical protein